MAPRRRKGAGDAGTAGAEREEAPREAIDPREEEGYSQPESSAQKAPRRSDEEPAPGHPE